MNIYTNEQVNREKVETTKKKDEWLMRSSAAFQPTVVEYVDEYRLKGNIATGGYGGFM